ncbi:MAG TPA: hypothetical protein VI565_09920, partial [Burkholderiales bacterium]|nr:hypothetical protein [Burkholderiales bacterium]
MTENVSNVGRFHPRVPKELANQACRTVSRRIHAQRVFASVAGGESQNLRESRRASLVRVFSRFKDERNCAFAKCVGAMVDERPDRASRIEAFGAEEVDA